MDIYDYYATLTTEQKTRFIKYMIEECSISYPSFFYKMRKRTWRPLELKVFEKHYKKIRDE